MALAPTLYNPGSRGQNSRYDVAGLAPDSTGRLFDGTYHYDSNGLAWDRPDVYVPGLPPADQMGGGGGGPSSGSFLAGDAEYNQMLQELKAQSVSDKASRDAGIKRSFVNFGLGNFDLAAAAKTTGIGDLASILDQDTLALAANNKFSVQQRLDRALADRARENRLSLRQRGGVRSGEAGFLAQRAQTDFETDQFDSTQKLLDYISGAQAAFAQAEQARKMQEFQLALAAAARRSSYGYGGGYAAPAAPSAPAPPTVGYWSDNQLPAGTPTMFRSPRDFLNL